MMIPPTCVTTSGDDIEIRDCTLQSLQLGGGRGHRIIGNEIDGGNLWAFGCNEITVRANRQHGIRWGVGLDLIGGSGHVIEDNDVSDDLCGDPAHRRDASRGSSANRVRTRWWGVHLRGCTGCESRDNEVDRTMRAQCVEGGAQNTVAGNTARRCDSSVLVEQGARDTVVGDNRAEDCRIDTLVWESTLRICSYRRDDGSVRVGIVERRQVRDAGTVRRGIRSPGEVVGPLDTVALVAPVPPPGKVVCVGRNYAEHAAETGSAVPTEPQLFAKWANAVVGPGADVVLPPITQRAGLRGRARRGHRHAPRAGSPRRTHSTTCSGTRAATTSRRVTCSSATRSGRAARRSTRSRRWVRRSSRPTRSPTRRSLGIRCLVNGETRQDDTTAHMVFSGRADHRVRHRGDHARSRRRDLHRDAARRRPRADAADVPAARRHACGSRSIASAPSRTGS